MPDHFHRTARNGGAAPGRTVRGLAEMSEETGRDTNRTAVTAPYARPWRTVLPGRGLPAALPWLLALLVVAALRALTLGRDPWEWDEVLFTGAARDGVDVRVNHPHPPGYPVFALLGRALAVAGVEPFAAVLAVTAVAGLLAVPLLAAFAEEVGLPRGAARWGALLWALTPSVWLHSVRPLSDVPAAAAFFLAALLILRSARRASTGLLLGAALAAAACFGIRPQVGLALLPVATWAATRVARRRGARGRLAATALAGIAAAIVPYAAVVAASGGLHEYLVALRSQVEYVRQFDAPALADLLSAAFWSRWALDPFGSPAVAVAVWAAAVTGTALSARRAARVLAFFGPLGLLTVPVLAAHTAPRYGVGLVAVPCLLAALAAAEALRRYPRTAAAAAAALLGAVALPGVPALVEVSARPSPSAAAVEALASDPRLFGRPLLLDPALRAHADGRGIPAYAEIEPDQPLEIPAGGLVAAVDRVPVGLAPLRVDRLREPYLVRISRRRFLEVGIYDGGGLRRLAASVTGEESWTDRSGCIHLAPGGNVLFETDAHSLLVRAKTWAGSGGARLEVSGVEGAEDVQLPQGRGEISWEARGAFRVRVVRGTLSLDQVRLVVERPGPEDASAHVVAAEDRSIPASVDEPVEGAAVTGPLVVKGWSQRIGGGHVGPVEFRVDGRRVVPERIERAPRPDVTAALPAVGDASAAGWRAFFGEGALPPGPHALTVVFSDGERWRAYPVRKFTLAGGGGVRAAPAGASLR